VTYATVFEVSRIRKLYIDFSLIHGYQFWKNHQQTFDSYRQGRIESLPAKVRSSFLVKVVLYSFF